jgi:uncharacterized membrane protein YdjX (TVP38/TMEM64 family)
MTATLIGLTLTASVAASIISFRLGRAHGFGEILRIRMEAAQARRRMHELTRQAFTAMTEAANSARHHEHDHPDH